jgi:hypothetical protein
MKIKFSLFFSFLFFLNNLFSQDSLAIMDNLAKTDHSYLRIKTENDFWTTHGKSDRYFSNGIRIEYQMPQSWFKKARLKKIFITLPNKDYKKSKIIALGEMRMYTPEDLSATEPLIGDRPYAGLLTFGLGGVSNDFDSGQRITTEYQVGVVGPSAGQEYVQTSWHRFTKKRAPSVVIPEGWDNQISDFPALNIRTEYEKNIFSPVKNIETIGGFEINFGSVTNYISLNNQIRLGLFNDYFFNASGLKMRNKYVDGEALPCRKNFFAQNINRNIQAYFFVKTSFRFTLYNSLLQGGPLNSGSNIYVIPNDALKRFYFNGEFGYCFAYKRFSVMYTQMFRSPEFITAKQSKWGTLTLLFGLGS